MSAVPLRCRGVAATRSTGCTSARLRATVPLRFPSSTDVRGEIVAVLLRGTATRTDDESLAVIDGAVSRRGAASMRTVVSGRDTLDGAERSTRGAAAVRAGSGLRAIARGAGCDAGADGADGAERDEEGADGAECDDPPP